MSFITTKINLNSFWSNPDKNAKIPVTDVQFSYTSVTNVRHKISIPDLVLHRTSECYGDVVPHKIRNRILHELHDGHIGIVKMTGLARSYVWWPGIDQYIESLAKKCQICQKVQFEAPTVPLHPWEWPIEPWQRIHVDYAGPFMGHMFLIIVDAHSKWP